MGKRLITIAGFGLAAGAVLLAINPHRPEPKSDTTGRAGNGPAVATGTDSATAPTAAATADRPPARDFTARDPSDPAPSDGSRTPAAELEALVSDDPQSALDYVNRYDKGPERDALLEILARAWARHDAEAAIDWIATLGEDDGAAFYPVIEEVARVDLFRAIELDAWAIELDYPAGSFGSTGWFNAALDEGRESPARLAEELKGTPSPGLLGTVLQRWASEDPYGAIAWMQMQDSLPNLVIARAAVEIARSDFEGALVLGDQLSGEVRGEWLETVLETTARDDAVRAVAALERFADDAVYATAAEAVYTAIVWRTGADRAAELAGPAPSLAVAKIIGWRWAQEDPVAAMAWSSGLENADAREVAAQLVVSAWFQHDARAATEWVDSLADPKLRTRMHAVLCDQGRACGARL